ncbi:MAG: lysostaphin resistance A-like protein [Candidatus Villigracilaceae bacterium]
MTDTQTTPKRSILMHIFVSPNEPRLRAGWRLLLQILFMVIIGLVVGMPAGTLAMTLGIDPGGMLFGQVVQFVIVTGSVFLAIKLLDRRPIVAIGLKLNRRVAVDLLAGIVITFFMMGFIFIIQLLLGWLTFERFAWQTDPLQTVLIQTVGAFVVFLFVGWTEELLSRGYHLQTIASGLNLTWGIILSSAVFGLLHLGNPNATWVSAAGILFAGLFLAYGYIRTKQLWLPIGLHIGWNFFEGPLFGFPVSGLKTFRLMNLHISGPELWTGGAFGPEAGLIILPALALGASLIYLYTHLLPPEQA